MAYTEEEGKRLVIQAGLELVKAGLIARTWGNISARISDTEFVITPSGMAYDSLTPDKIVKVKIADCSYEGEIKPSSEKGVHAEGYRLRPDCNFIVHTHQLLATAVSVTGENIAVDDDYKELLGDYVANAAYAISSTKALKKKVSACIEGNPKSRAILMRSHGTVCLGSSYEDAFAISKALEEVSYLKLAQELASKGFSLPEEALQAQDGRFAVDKELVIGKLIEAFGSRNKIAEREVTSSIPQPLVDAINKACGAPFISLNVDPMVKAIAAAGKKVIPIIDDMAQIGGVSFANVTTEDLGNPTKVLNGLQGCTLILVQDLGAIMVAPDEDELQAIRMVMDKDFVAELYSNLCGGAKHLGWFDAKLQRTVYVKKYSKLK